jgi:hypothetical protein
MLEFLQSIFRFGWAMSLMGIRELVGTLTPPAALSPPGPDFAAANLGLASPANSASSGAQTFNQAQSAALPELGPPDSGSLNTSRFIVLGEGLAAGASDFSMSADTQIWSFPAQMARQMGAVFPQRLIQPPGIGNFVGFASLPVRIPGMLQSTVVEQLPPGPISNLSVPEFRLDDALELRPRQPLVDRKNAKQTAVNLAWGLLPIAHGQQSLPTQMEYALQQSPTFAVVELGYYEALEAAVAGKIDRLPEPRRFREQYECILSGLRRCGAEVLVLNIPDPFDTAYFSSVEAAAEIAKVEPSFIVSRYGIRVNDLVTLNGLNEIGFQIFRKSLGALGPGSILHSAIAENIRGHIAELNSALADLAGQNGALLYDLAGLFRRVANGGYPAGGRLLSRQYLGGFYSLNGYYPGQTGQAIVANEILDLLNARYGANFSPIDLSTVISSDPAAACRPAQGPAWPSAQLAQLPFDPDPQENESCSKEPNEIVARRHDDFSVSSNWKPLAPLTPPVPAKLPLQLPPGLEQVLPLSTAASYFGDGISALNVRNPKEAFYGSTANFIFGGLAMVDSHLSGSIRIKFTPPSNNVSHFELSFMGGFTGEDSVLLAPQFFKMGFQQNRVDEVPGLISSGDLNLETGEVGNLTLYALYRSTALSALASVNPNFPKSPITFQNPPPSNCPPPTPQQQQIYASSWAEFEQRADGQLDFTFYGSMFVPLGPGTVWPLNFSGPSGLPATVPASGTVLHPHLQLSTKDPERSNDDLSECIPFNSIQEFTLFTHNSAFGDAFTLNAPHLGGPAKGRSHLLGRLQIQFGGRAGNSVPVAIWALPPGGIMAPMPANPVTAVFPAHLANGPQGFNENLRFPMRTYPLDDLSIIEDPFDISVGAMDLKTGRFLNSLLHRAFISQDLIFALLRVEPCTPQSSFFFRGPAEFVRGPHNEWVFRFQGIVHIPYPAGLKFPNPDFATGFTVGPDSSLDPFLWFHAIENGTSCGIVKEGGGAHVRASTGDEFSFRYLIPSDPLSKQAVFEYENHTQEGKFRMYSLAWVGFSNSGTSKVRDGYDTLTFSGFGEWSKACSRTLQQVAVQVSTSAEKPYIGIQVADGDISNVNTKPQDERTALP